MGNSVNESRFYTLQLIQFRLENPLFFIQENLSQGRKAMRQLDRQTSPTGALKFSIQKVKKYTMIHIS